MIIHLNDNFLDNEILDSKRPVLVDFWSEWCGPCRALTPILEEISNEYAENFIVAKLNIYTYPDLVSKYR